MNIDQWNNYAACFSDEPENSEVNILFNALINDQKIASVIKYHFKNNYMEWLDRRIDALNGRTPRECLTSESARDELREMLMRIP